MFRGGKVPGYDPPISLALAEFQNGVEEQLGNGVMEYLYSIDIHVDKEELINALKYDRGQYEKGYQDGCRDSLKVGEWTTIEDDILMETIYQCSVCKEEFVTMDDETPQKHLWNCCPCCGSIMDMEAYLKVREEIKRRATNE
jgi:DNA-directed RNA polymerase subunit RPC12/RpoP